MNRKQRRAAHSSSSSSSPMMLKVDEPHGLPQDLVDEVIYRVLGAKRELGDKWRPVAYGLRLAPMAREGCSVLMEANQHPEEVVSSLLGRGWPVVIYALEARMAGSTNEWALCIFVAKANLDHRLLIGIWVEDGNKIDIESYAFANAAGVAEA